MSQTQRQPLTDRETAADLRAAVEARRELGPEMEDAVIEAFLSRVEQRMGERGIVASKPEKAKPVPSKKDGKVNPAAIVAPSLALAIPLVAIAGSMGGGPAIVAVMATVLLINVLFFVDRWT